MGAGRLGQGEAECSSGGGSPPVNSYQVGKDPASGREELGGTPLPKRLRAKVALGYMQVAKNSEKEGLSALQELHAHTTAQAADEVWEICCNSPSGLTAEAQRVGLTAHRKAIPDYDLLRKQTLVKLLGEAGERKPRKVWFSPPCTDWPSTENLNARTPEQTAALERRRRRSLMLIFNGVKVLEAVLENGGDVYWEWPLRASGWKLPAVLRLMKFAERVGKTYHFTRVDGCMCGLASSQGERLQKPWRIFHTDGDFDRRIGRTCDQTHGHASTQAVETAATAFQPYQMAHEVVRLWRQQLRHTDSSWREVKLLLNRVEIEFYPILDKDEVKATAAEVERIRALLHKVHRAAGHPSNANLARLIAERGYPNWVIQEARKLECPACVEAKQGERHKIPVNLDTRVGPWDCVGLDAFE